MSGRRGKIRVFRGVEKGIRNDSEGRMAYKRLGHGRGGIAAVDLNGRGIS